MPRFCFWSSAIVAVILSILAPGRLSAQGTDLGTIRGVVTDASGAVVPNASVTITDVATNIARTLTTNADGVYEASSLRSGDYKVTIASQGFNTAEITGVTLRSGSIARADARLDVSRSAESVVVRSDAPIIQTESPVISSTLSNETLVSIPRDSRDIYSFLYLSPNISRGGTEDSFKFIGAQSYGASFSLDGQRSNGVMFGEPTASQPSIETVGEVNISRTASAPNMPVSQCSRNNATGRI